MKRYADPGAAIQVSAGSRFAIELEGNPSTGYTWEAHVDSHHLELLGQEFEPYGFGIGVAGLEILSFRAVAAGETVIRCEYRRPWEQESRGEKQFRVAISE